MRSELRETRLSVKDLVDEVASTANFESKKLMMEAYQASGIAKAEAAKVDICQDIMANDAKTRVHVVSLDLSSLDSVRAAAKQVKDSFGKIHVLINNAGVMMGQQNMTADGYDMVMQANHLGHYLWTRLLLDRMDKEGRILCLTSSTYSYAERIDLDDLFCTKGRRVYSLFGQYAQSKLANILFVQEEELKRQRQ